MAQVFGLIFVFVIYGNLDRINPSSWIVLSTASMPFVFLENLDLRLTHVSRRGFMGLSLVLVSVLVLLTGFIFFFLRGWPIALWIPGVDLPSPGSSLKTGLFHYFSLQIQIVPLVIPCARMLKRKPSQK